MTFQTLRRKKKEVNHLLNRSTEHSRLPVHDEIVSRKCPQRVILSGVNVLHIIILYTRVIHQQTHENAPNERVLH